MPANDDNANVLWLYMNRDVPRTDGVGGTLDVRSQARIAELEQIRDSFDLATATGHELEVLGAIVGELRLGLSDADLRTTIEAKILVLAGNGSSGLATGDADPPGLIQIWVAITGISPTHYGEIYPHYILIGGAVDMADEPVLERMLLQAVPGGRVLAVSSFILGDLIPEYGQIPGVGTGRVDYSQIPIVGAATLSYRIF